MPGQGTITVDFGSKGTDVSVFVAAPTIGSSNLVEAWVFPATTASNTADNHWVESLQVTAGNVQDGVGFTIYAKVNIGLGHGIYNIGWVWN